MTDMDNRYAMKTLGDESHRKLLSNDDDEEEVGENETLIRQQPVPSDPRFDQPTPSPFARAGLLLLVTFLFWLAFSLRKAVWEGKSSERSSDTSW
ncbi:uncharacterized protein EV420DRAFT_1752520 [Desarmillaria tabescens]|uniref:Uncharacterized protein n=1 Tax=Armillaria tabescens TaxID=1929756 RepID=A0AA39MPP5_ARMTA|nr:uncharacterized protein EV420DRAFT_1752520 [Desarmillaria tabescens]KAK0441215.1 hypothetical protein EV420DRAFT_1752520 [Desarmillaria tabescens]